MPQEAGAGSPAWPGCPPTCSPDAPGRGYGKRGDQPSGPNERDRDSETPRSPGQIPVSGCQTEPLDVGKGEMKGIQRPQRQREPGQPPAGGLVVLPLDRDARVEACPEMVEKLLASARGVRGRHLSHADLSSERRKELDLDQIADCRPR